MLTGDFPPPPIMTEEQERDRELASAGRDLFHRLGLGPFGAGDHLKLYLIPFIERLEARLFNSRVVNKDIWTIVLRNETKPFLLVKPLDRTAGHGWILLTGD
jgi:hypothetical protein